ncbi:hypothetical protein [Saccharothrix luteola]|uniref:hypothetical protein n=1 Tax=Saccharothrix luteola TaxID=2893018 RepID=UPI001E2ED8D3|nr:hypothetical protein [Saccharothrix luteola]MCC8242879.1 hypothetical protein [Saccharothrix luteola]
MVGHSLGGIAVVDLLPLPNPPTVVLLVTVGSQSPVLYGVQGIKDEEADARVPFPESHSAYWEVPRTFELIGEHWLKSSPDGVGAGDVAGR